MSSPRFSVAIPAYNEERLLPRLLDSIEVARRRYAEKVRLETFLGSGWSRDALVAKNVIPRRASNRDGGGAAPSEQDNLDSIEVIVGDNGSTDSTATIARERGCVVAPVEKRMIAAARNGAARVARGEILCFIDADSILHPETFVEIDAVMKNGRCVIGASGVKMERMSLGIAVTWLMMVPMTRVARVDTGVVFCRREDFATVGGYREEMMVAEDVDFMVRMKRHGRRQRAGFCRLPTARTITSTRKFDRHGDWHYIPLMLGLPLKFLFARRALNREVWKYWYER
jgi:glycosyltransferase involved in cell wall biosynthesis